MTKGDFIYKHRVVPRIMLFLYAILLCITLVWYLDFPVEYQVRTDAQLVQVLIDAGKSPDTAVLMASTKVEAIGRPHGYTALLSAMFAAAPFMFGFYVNGRVEIPNARNNNQ